MRYVYLYISAGAVFLILLLVTVVPKLVGSGAFLYNENVLNILYAVIALAVAMVTFGVIGDSGAVVNFNQPTGTAVQVAGSAAGFVVFYTILTYGLNPYAYIDIFLYRSENNLMSPSDGKFEIRLVSHISQSIETNNGKASFPVPRSEETVRLAINNTEGRFWKIKDVRPTRCYGTGSTIALECDEIDVVMEKDDEGVCLKNVLISSHESKPIVTTLETVVDSLKEKLQEFSTDLSVTVQYSPKLIESKLQTIEFELERKNESARSVCEHLASIENRFNLSIGKEAVKSYLSCTQILLNVSGEKAGKDYVSCL